MKHPKVSIIVPVYNAASFLDQCIASILSQSFKDFELLLIDDGSKDESGVLCDEYARKDARVKAYHKENGGVSSARNLGLNKAKGKYICFIDPDDWVHKEYIKFLVHGFSNKIGLSMCGYNKVDERGNVYFSYTKNIPTFFSRDYCLKLFFNRDVKQYQRYLWNRMLLMNIIKKHSIYFKENIYYKEDGLFLVEYLSSEKMDIYMTNENLYFYRMNRNSAMEKIQQAFQPKFISNLEAYTAIIDSIKRINNNYLTYQAMFSMTNCYFYIKKMLKQFNIKDKVITKRINDIYRYSVPIHYIIIIICHKILIKTKLLKSI